MNTKETKDTKDDKAAAPPTKISTDQPAKVTSEGNPSVSRRTQAEMQGGKQALKNQQANQKSKEGQKPKEGE
jgi:hypothetical protein